MRLQSLIIENQSKAYQIVELVKNVTNGELTVDVNGKLSWNTEDAYNNQDEILESVYEAIETEIEL